MVVKSENILQIMILMAEFEAKLDKIGVGIFWNIEKHLLNSKIPRAEKRYSWVYLRSGNILRRYRNIENI